MHLIEGTHKLKDLIAAQASVVAHSKNVAATVSGSTVGSGIATMLEWIPTDIGKLATLVGLVLSVVLIYTHVTQHKARMALLKFELEERRERKGRLDRRDDQDD